MDLINKLLNIIELILTGFLIIIITSCDLVMTSEPNLESILNKPADGLSGSQLAQHFQGDNEFARIFSQDDGLGPIFVSNSCESCHFADGKGHPFIQLTRFGRQKADGSFDPMIEFGGPQLQQRAIASYLAEELPIGITGKTVLIPPAVAGLGFLAAVHDSTILSFSDPDDINNDGISGVPNLISPLPYFQPQSFHINMNGKYVGRFGRKASAIDLLHQVTGAYINDIGITSDFVTEDLYNYKVGKYVGDQIPEPEVSSAAVFKVVFYLRTLSVPQRRNISSPEVTEGDSIFKKIGCNGCHIPSMKTSFSEIEALSNKTFYPYTDLLLHDLGEELDDNYTEGTATTSEWRTTPLWGLGLNSSSQGGNAYYLHDGRAKTMEEVINFHGGEAVKCRENFLKLTPREKDNLIKFLMSL